MHIEHQDILALIKAALEANYTDVKNASNRIASSFSKENIEVAKQIKSLIRKKGVPLRSSGYSDALPVDAKSRSPLIEEHSWPVTPLFLNEDQKNIFDTFVSDVLNIEILVEHGLAGRLNLLLSGPPGTGKTLIAGHIAAQLGRPLYVVRLDSVISSLLGDTAKNLRQVFDFVPSKNGVLFLDEVDAVAKLRDDTHEVGELKRVVNTLIQGLDSLDDQSVVIAATNHSGLLDHAIWRRFPYKIRFELPSLEVRKDLINHYLFLDKGEEWMLTTLAAISKDLSGADIENVCLSARRRSILSGKPICVASVARAILASETDHTAIAFNQELNTAEKRHTAQELHTKHEISKVDLSKLLNVSRQTISSYFRD